MWIQIHSKQDSDGRWNQRKHKSYDDPKALFVCYLHICLCVIDFDLSEHVCVCEMSRLRKSQFGNSAISAVTIPMKKTTHWIVEWSCHVDILFANKMCILMNQLTNDDTWLSPTQSNSFGPCRWPIMGSHKAHQWTKNYINHIKPNCTTNALLYCWERQDEGERVHSTCPSRNVRRSTETYRVPSHQTVFSFSLKTAVFK